MMWQLSANYGIVFAILAGNDYNPIQIKKASSEELAPNRLELRKQLRLVCNQSLRMVSTETVAKLSYRVCLHAHSYIYYSDRLIRLTALTGVIATTGVPSIPRAPPVRPV